MPDKRIDVRPSSYSVLTAGILSPLVSAYLGMNVYASLTRNSTARDQDFIYRLSMVTLAMIVPFVITFGLALWNRRKRTWNRIEKAGLGFAVLSLLFAAVPLKALVDRWQQSRNLSLEDVAAPAFDTVDLSGQRQRFADYSGKVVLVNVWATWCGPCKREMPALDRLYRERKSEGFAVLGFSPEDVDLQRMFVEDVVPVSYPLLTPQGNVPSLYREVVRYPAIFLIDRKGRLRPAPAPGEPFERVEAAVDALLKANPE